MSWLTLKSVSQVFSKHAELPRLEDLERSKLSAMQGFATLNIPALSAAAQLVKKHTYTDIDDEIRESIGASRDDIVVMIPLLPQLGDLDKILTLLWKLGKGVAAKKALTVAQKKSLEDARVPLMMALHRYIRVVCARLGYVLMRIDKDEVMQAFYNAEADQGEGFKGVEENPERYLS